MKLKEALGKISYKDAQNIILAVSNGKVSSFYIMRVFDVIYKNNEAAPNNIGGKYDDEKSCIEKWANKFINAVNNRTSLRISNLSKTVPDPIIEKIIGERISKLSSQELNSITFAHRLAMAAENIQGALLEEYLAEELDKHGWSCAWGETVKAVDFVGSKGELLQVKNRSNSENSSSSAIRNGTQIEKWYRIEANRVEYKWEELNKMLGISHLSENGFVKFVGRVLKQNPECLAIEAENPWL